MQTTEYFFLMNFHVNDFVVVILLGSGSVNPITVYSYGFLFSSDYNVSGEPFSLFYHSALI